MKNKYVISLIFNKCTKDGLKISMCVGKNKIKYSKNNTTVEKKIQQTVKDNSRYKYRGHIEQNVNCNHQKIHQINESTWAYFP